MAQKHFPKAWTGDNAIRMDKSEENAATRKLGLSARNMEISSPLATGQTPNSAPF